MLRRRRPLMRAAMVGGAGYMAGKSSARKQQHEGEQEARIAELEAQQPAAPQPAAPAPAAAAAGGTDVVSKLKELAELKSAGIIDDAEFDAAKQKLLQG